MTALASLAALAAAFALFFVFFFVLLLLSFSTIGVVTFSFFTSSLVVCISLSLMMLAVIAPGHRHAEALPSLTALAAPPLPFVRLCFFRLMIDVGAVVAVVMVAMNKED